MKIHCRNNCGRHVRYPRLECWKKRGLCPDCDYDISVPIQSGLIDVMNVFRKRNPVDIYWHHLTLREIYLDDNR